jgi:protein TonB
MHALRTAVCLTVVLACLASAEGLREITQAEALAAVVTRIPPEFPEMAKQLKLSGAVEIEIAISESGAVESAKPVNGNPVLTKSAVDALKRWKFKPFLQGGTPTKVQTTLKITFTK